MLLSLWPSHAIIVAPKWLGNTLINGQLQNKWPVSS